MTEPSPPQTSTPLTIARSPAEDVFAATEQIRMVEFPTVPAELLAAVLAAEQDNPDSRPTAVRAVGRAVDRYLADHPGDLAPAPSDTGAAAAEGTSS
jgi:hypothetical protein